MGKAVRVGDIGTDHDGFHPSKVTAGSGTVIIDGKPAARVGDPLEPHDKPKNPKHGRVVATGSSTVFIDGKAAAITGGKVSCGGVTIGGGTVNIADVVNEAGIPVLAPIFNRKFIITDTEGTPIPNIEYKLEVETGEVITGTTTAEGETDFAYSKDAPIGIKVSTRMNFDAE